MSVIFCNSCVSCMELSDQLWVLLAQSTLKVIRVKQVVNHKPRTVHATGHLMFEENGGK